MQKSVIGILAHVDAGKTTLAESILFKSGKIRKLGRVDNGDTQLDTHELEKSRGITIFASQAMFNLGQKEITLLDTPGHVDFSAETERILQVLDYAILVISATDGVQSHTSTLWNLLKSYHIPTVIFVTKTDFGRRENEEIMSELQTELSENCIDFSPSNADKNELLAMCREDIMESFLECGEVAKEQISSLVAARNVFPCFFGSGLKMEGIDEFLNELDSIIDDKIYPEEFGARVFKITHDQNGAKVAHLKITGGTLRVRDVVDVGEKQEKISGIRIYSGAKFTQTDEMTSGGICAITGLSEVAGGMGLGAESNAKKPFLEPVMNYTLVLPEGADAKKFMPDLKMLEEEDPLLRIFWDSHRSEINVSLMGEIQVEILKSLISERFNLDVDFVNGRVLYKETIENTVEGVGHYEPLRHYAEVHLILSPLERGKGLVFETRCNEDVLDRNWQRLIMMHLKEKVHKGVLTGSPLTDVKITLALGKAHLKHTEGGDFRQATYRAVRQGLMTAKSKLLEPYFSFKLEVPAEQIGRAITDIKTMGGTFDAPEQSGSVAILCGTAPVAEMNGYAAEVASYTSGKGRLRMNVCGYGECKNAEKIIADLNYLPESDLENTPDSVFCAHGAGFTVKWDSVTQYMHLETCLKSEIKPMNSSLQRRNFSIDDKELEAIMDRTFGKAKTTQTLYRPITRKEITREYDMSDSEPKQKYILVDGYNCIFAWERLKEFADYDISMAREKLADILCNYSAFTKTKVVLVFDGYRVSGNQGETLTYKNINIAYTKEHELADVYIEKMISEIGKNYNVRVVTSDNMIRLTATRHGVLRVSALDFEKEIDETQEKIAEIIKNGL